VAVSAPALHDALVDIVGPPHVRRDPAALAAYAVDGLVPTAVVTPGSCDEASRILALCVAERLAVVPRGSGSSQGLGNPPRRLDIVLELGRLTAIRDYVPEDMVATVEAGATLDDLAARFTVHRQMLALDPPGAGGRTVGGVLATHASGPRRFRHGTGRDLLLGARFVQADGMVTWGGARVVKSVTGYDVPKLLVGSMGTLGVLVEVTLRLHPLPPASHSWRLGFSTPAGARDFLAALLDSPIEPDRAALLDAEGLRRLGLSADPLALLLSIGSVPEAVDAQGQALSRLADGHRARGERIPEATWSGLGEVVAGPVLLRAAAEPRQLLDWVAEIRLAGSRVGVALAMLGQPGHGVLQVAVNGGDPRRIALEIVLPVRQALEAQGGSLVVERGPVELKSACDVWGSIDPEILGIMKRIKTEFDPGGILSPGRFVGGL